MILNLFLLFDVFMSSRFVVFFFNQLHKWFYNNDKGDFTCFKRHSIYSDWNAGRWRHLADVTWTTRALWFKGHETSSGLQLRAARIFILYLNHVFSWSNRFSNFSYQPMRSHHQTIHQSASSDWKQHFIQQFLVNSDPTTSRSTKLAVLIVHLIEKNNCL